MKILHVEDFFHPDAGYQINILPKYLQHFGHENVIITSEMKKIPAYLTDFFGRENIPARDAAFYDMTGVRILRLPILRYVSGRSIFTSALLKEIQNEQPDLLYIHGNDTLTAMQLMLQSKKLSCAVVFDSHMLAMASQNKLNHCFHFFYRHTFSRYIIRHHLPVIRTQNDDYVKTHLGIPLTQAPWISYGSDTLLFHPDDTAKRRFREKHGIPQDAFVILYCGKLDESKGGMLLAQAIEKKLSAEKEPVFAVVGNVSGDYGAQVEECFGRSENTVLRFPTQRYTQLPEFYQMADLAVFPKQCSLSFYDVQACGVPVLCENNHVNTERCSHGNGFLFEENSIAQFRSGLTAVLNMSESDYMAVRDRAAAFIKENYDYEDKAREYEAILLEAFHRFQGDTA